MDPPLLLDVPALLACQPQLEGDVVSKVEFLLAGEVVGAVQVLYGVVKTVLLKQGFAFFLRDKCMVSIRNLDVMSNEKHTASSQLILSVAKLFPGYFLVWLRICDKDHINTNKEPKHSIEKNSCNDLQSKGTRKIFLRSIN